MSFRRFPPPSPGRLEHPTPSLAPELRADHDARLLGAAGKLGHIRVSTESRLSIACQTTALRCAANTNASIQANTRCAELAVTARTLFLATSLVSANTPSHETGWPPAIDPR